MKNSFGTLFEIERCGNIVKIGTGTKETDAVKSSGFTANRFMSSMSSSINDALESYKELKEATEEKDTKEATEANESAVQKEEQQEKAGAELGALA